MSSWADPFLFTTQYKIDDNGRQPVIALSSNLSLGHMYDISSDGSHEILWLYSRLFGLQGITRYIITR